MSIRRFAIGFVLVLLAVVVAVPSALAADSRHDSMRVLPGRQVDVRAGHSSHRARPVLPASRTSLRVAQAVTPTATADIEVDYIGDWPLEAMAAFEAAVVVWEAHIVSSQVINVDATWEDLGDFGVLGSAGPDAFYALPDGRAYPVALAEAICSCEENGLADVEIMASFNSHFNAWHFDPNTNPPSTRYDFTTVVLHELGHGLGFLSSFWVNPNGIKGFWGLRDSFNNAYALNFDVKEWSAASGGVKLTSYSPYGSKALKTQLTDGSVYFGGTNVVAANGGRAKLYAPSPWEDGSSNSHFDELAFPAGTADALMTPLIGNGEVNHVPGPVLLALFRDIGWATSDGGSEPNGTPPVVSAPVGTIPEGQKVTSTSVLHLSWPDATDDAGIASYELQRKQGSGAFTAVTLPSPTATSVDVALTRGSTYTFRLRATDTTGTTSDWVTTPAGTLTLLQETAGTITYAGSWKRVRLSGASGKRVQKSATAGATATLSFTGTSVAFVSTQAAARGIAEIRLDGVLQDTVDMYRASARKKWVVWAPDAPLSAGPHTLEVRVTGTHNPSATKDRIDVDAFLIWP